MKLTIIGQGVKKLSQITMEGFEALQNAEKVLHVAFDPMGTQNWLSSKGIVQAESIKGLYESRVKDENNYRNILDKIYSELREHKNVAVLLPGHPRIGVTILQWIEKEKEDLGISLRVLPGVSSFATMINDLKVDPLEKGSQIVDANRLLLFKQHINPQLDAYIYHVCSVGTSIVHLEDASKDNHINWLKKHLLKYYPENHKVTLISSSIDENEDRPSMTVVELKDFDKIINKIHFGTTLFVPGIKPKTYDLSYLNLLRYSMSKSEAQSVG